MKNGHFLLIEIFEFETMANYYTSSVSLLFLLEFVKVLSVPKIVKVPVTF